MITQLGIQRAHHGQFSPNRDPSVGARNCNFRRFIKQMALHKQTLAKEIVKINLVNLNQVDALNVR